MIHKTRTEQLAEFLQFLGEARSFLKQNRLSKRHPEVQLIRSELEENNQGEHSQPYQKFESTFYEDAPNTVALWNFFRKFECDQLRRYHMLAKMELSGLMGDYHPRAIFGRSVLGTAALLLGCGTVWWGLIKLICGEDSGKLSSDFFQDLLNTVTINRVVGVISIVGMFVVVWYVLRMVRNRKQVAFLSSLSRALTLYLDGLDSQNNR